MQPIASPRLLFPSNMVVHNTASTCITTVAHCVLLWSSFDRGAGLNTRASVLRTDPRLPVQEFMSTPLSMRNGGRALSRYRRRRQIRKSMKPGEMARSVANVRLPVHRSTLNEPSSIVIRAVSFRFRLFRLSVSKYWAADSRREILVISFSCLHFRSLIEKRLDEGALNGRFVVWFAYS